MSPGNRRIVQNRAGVPAEVADLEEVPIPAPGPGELLVELVLAPINPAELLMFEGGYGHRETVPPLPRLAGIEGVGRVVGGATDIVPEGSLVSLAGSPAVFADYRVIPADRALVLPAGADPESVAIGLVNAQAVLVMLEESPELAEGSWIIQNAGNSGYGRIVDTIAASRGFSVVNVVRSADGAGAIAESARGPVVIDGPALEVDVLAATSGIRPSLAFDAVGGEATGRLAATLAPGSRIRTYGLMSGEDCRIDTRLIVFGGIRLDGFWMPRSMSLLDAAALARIQQEALGHVVDGGIGIPIEARYGLADIGAALTHANRPHRRGKVVITR